MDAQLFQILGEVLPPSVLAGVALIVALRGRNGKGRHTVEATVQDILAAREQAQETTQYRAETLRRLADHEEILQTLRSQLDAVRQHIEPHDFDVYRTTLEAVLGTVQEIKADVQALKRGDAA